MPPFLLFFVPPFWQFANFGRGRLSPPAFFSSQIIVFYKKEEKKNRNVLPVEQRFASHGSIHANTIIVSVVIRAR